MARRLSGGPGCGLVAPWLWAQAQAVPARAATAVAWRRIFWQRQGWAAINWTRLSCHGFRANAVRLHLHTLSYNLANFLRTLGLPAEVARWSLTTLREKLVKIGAKVVRHGRAIIFQMAEVAVPRSLFREILRLIGALRPAPAPS